MLYKLSRDGELVKAVSKRLRELLGDNLPPELPAQILSKLEQGDRASRLTFYNIQEPTERWLAREVLKVVDGYFKAHR